MQLNTVEELITDFRQGKMVILMDDENRENEGDLILAAEMVRPDDINFMVKYARGLVCLPMTKERCEFLKLPLMVSDNNAKHSTNFTVSIEAADGVTTGISAGDRAHTIKVAVSRQSRPEDIVQPGHIFPLMAQPGGVLSRAGHTEAGCDLARMAGFQPAAVIVEIMNDDGSMARRPELEAFAQAHDLKIGTIADLIHYRVLNEQTIVRESEADLETEYGTFRLLTYRDTIQGATHLALVKGVPSPTRPVLVRVHFEDILKDLFSAVRDTGDSWPIGKALARIAAEEEGVLVLLDAGKGVKNVTRQIENYFQPSLRRRQVEVSSSGAYLTIGTGSQILRDIGVGKMRVMSAPMRFSALSGFELEVVDYVPFR